MANWNPWHGCHKYSEGCRNCYVYRMDSAYNKDSSVVTINNDFDLPIKKKKNKEYKIPSEELVYTCFSSDFFVNDADIWRIDAWKMMKERSDLHFLFITKRIDRFYECIPDDWEDGYDNVSIYVTCENQDRADFRLNIYKDLPIKHKGIICEPILSKIDLTKYLDSSIEQVVVGGESGTQARICDYSWVLDIKEQCSKRNINFWFKQTGAKFLKDKKLYRVPKRYQGIQAKKANINLEKNI